MTVNEIERTGSPIAPIIRFFKAPEWGLVAGIMAVLGLIHFLDKDGAFFQVYSLRTLIHRLSLFGCSRSVPRSSSSPEGSTSPPGPSSRLLGRECQAADGMATRSAPSGAPPSVAIIGLAIGLTLLMGLVIGLFHAFMINQLSLPPFIATLATMAGLRSLASVLAQSRTINVTYDWYRVWGSNPWYSVPLFAIVATVLSVLMGCTVLGRHLYALGGNEIAARLSGLRTQRLKAITYGISGTLSALGGILFTGLSGQADSRLGNTYELTAITAAVVGGCSLSGGVGSIRGTVLGLLLTRIVIQGTGLVVRGIDSTQIEGLVLGTVVVLAVAVNQRFRLRKD